MYRDQMSRTNELVESLSKFGNAVGKVEEQKRQEEMAQAGVVASQIIGQLSNDGDVIEQINALTPDRNPLFRAAVAEEIGRQQGAVAGQRLIEELAQNPQIETDPNLTDQFFRQKAGEEAARVGQTGYYGPAYMKAVREQVVKRSNSLSTERVKAGQAAVVQGFQKRLYDQGVTLTDPKTIVAVTDQTERTPNARGYGDVLTGKITVNGNTYEFINGGGGRGSIPFGSYNIGQFRTAAQRKAQGLVDLGDTFDLSDVNDPLAPEGPRTALRIHKARRGGTAGCIGIIGDDETFRRFSEDVKAAGSVSVVLTPPGGVPQAVSGTPAQASTPSFPEVKPEEYFGGDTASLPAGMRNNNIGNIKHSNWSRRLPGAVGPSVNTDQGDPQVVFSSPEAGVAGAARLALNKYNKGMTSVNKLIAGEGGWTPGYTQAAVNIAKTLGISPDDDLNLKDEAQMVRFIRALARQEHGEKADLFKDETVSAGVKAGMTQATARQVAPPSDEPSLPSHVMAIRQMILREDARYRAVANNQIANADFKAAAINSVISMAKDARGGMGDVSILKAVPDQWLTPTERNTLRTAETNILAFQRQRIQEQEAQANKVKQEMEVKAKVELNGYAERNEPIPLERRENIGKMFPDLLKTFDATRTSIQAGMQADPDRNVMVAARFMRDMEIAHELGTDSFEFLKENEGMHNIMKGTPQYTEVIKRADELKKSQRELYHQAYKDMTMIFMNTQYGVADYTKIDPKQNPTAQKAYSFLRERLIRNINDYLEKNKRLVGGDENGRTEIFRKAAEEVLARFATTGIKPSGVGKPQTNSRDTLDPVQQRAIDLYR
jgi:hypothetical protein